MRDVNGAAPRTTRASGDAQRLVLLTGATGYVGGRLLARARGARACRCAASRAGRSTCAARVGATTEVVHGDVLDPASLGAGARGRRHRLLPRPLDGLDGRLREQDRSRGAQLRRRRARAPACGASSTSAGSATRRATSRRTCASRHEVGDVLRESGVPVLELRASIVIGSGSLSFEMIRALVERLPVMITPRWVDVPAQPIAIDDLLALPGRGARRAARRRAAIVRDRRRRPRVVRRPDARVRAPARAAAADDPRARADAAPLEPVARAGDAALRARRPQAGREHPPRDRRARSTPRASCSPIRPTRHARGDRGRARATRTREFAATRWSDALSSAGEPATGTDVRFGQRLVDSRERARAGLRRRRPSRRSGASAARSGWYACDWLWQLRGLLDLLVGGVGMRRGRRDPEELRVGDALDFWRVEAYRARPPAAALRPR